jgi:hypothetical protein
MGQVKADAACLLPFYVLVILTDFSTDLGRLTSSEKPFPLLGPMPWNSFISFTFLFE